MNLMKIIKLQNLILSLMAYEKLNHLIFTYKVVTWHCVDVSLLSYFSHSVLFFFINSFRASLFLLMPLPHSLPIYLSQATTISIYLSIYLSISLAQSPFYSPYRCYFGIDSRYLTLSLIFSLFGATSHDRSLYLRDIIPLLSFLFWYNLYIHISDKFLFFVLLSSSIFILSLTLILFFVPSLSQSVGISFCDSFSFSFSFSLYHCQSLYDITRFCMIYCIIWYCIWQYDIMH